MAEPRWLDRDGLADYLRLRPDAIHRYQKAGRLPKPSYHLGPRQPRWDVRLVDAAMEGGVASTDPRTAIQALAEQIARARPTRRSQAPS